MQRKKANRQHLFSSEALSKPVCFVPRSTQEVCNADVFQGGGGVGSVFTVFGAKTNRCRSQKSEDDIK